MEATVAKKGDRVRVRLRDGTLRETGTVMLVWGVPMMADRIYDVMTDEGETVSVIPELGDELEVTP